MDTTPFLLLAFLAGCGQRAPDSASDDTGADTDTDTDAGVCPPWSGIHGLGTTWAWDYDSQGYVGSGTKTVTAFDEVSGAATIALDLEISGGGQDMVVHQEESAFCDPGGLWFTAVSVWYKGDGMDTSEAYYQFDAPALVLPWDLAVGVSWTTDRSGTVSAPDQPPSDCEDVMGFTVEAAETVTVPAGTWEALRVVDTVGANWTRWFALDTGLVQDNAYSLVAYTP